MIAVRSPGDALNELHVAIAAGSLREATGAVLGHGVLHGDAGRSRKIELMAAGAALIGREPRVATDRVRAAARVPAARGDDLAGHEVAGDAPHAHRLRVRAGVVGRIGLGRMAATTEGQRLDRVGPLEDAIRERLPVQRGAPFGRDVLVARLATLVLDARGEALRSPLRRRSRQRRQRIAAHAGRGCEQQRGQRHDGGTRDTRCPPFTGGRPTPPAHVRSG
ncbi:hypothetical protein WMF39_30940 [Sorangium sp. So ce1504]